MALWTLIKNLPGRIAINDTIKEVSNTRNSIITDLIPNITAVNKAIPNPASEFAKGLEKRFSIFNKKAFKGKNAFEIIEIAANNMVEYLTFIYKHPHTFSEVETTQGITLDRATHLKLINIAKYLSIKLPSIINYMVSCELVKSSEEARKKNKHSTVYTIKDLYDAPKLLTKVSESIENSIPGISIFANNLADIEAAITHLPKGVILNEITENTLGHAHNLDPLGLNGFIPFDIPFNLNPFYYIGAIKVKWDNYVYEATKDEYQLVSLKLIELQQIQSYGGDAATEKQIAYYQEKVKRLEISIRDYEEAHSGN